MLLDVNHVIWGVAFDVTITLVLGVLVASVIKLRKQNSKALRACQVERATPDAAQLKKERRALMHIMNRKNDSMLAALAGTIELERQKLGVVVRNPSMSDGIDANHTSGSQISGRPQTAYERVLPLAQNGTSTAAIASRLELSEAEVSLVMRLNAA